MPKSEQDLIEFLVNPDKFQQLKSLSKAISELQKVQEAILDSCMDKDLKKLYRIDKHLAYDVYDRLAKEAGQHLSYVEVMNDVDELMSPRKKQKS